MAPSKSPQISAVLIVKNELRNLQLTLPQLRFCDEIVIVDSGSTDGTVEYARAQGARVLHRDFDGYGSQKAFGVNAASHDWIFNVDADEFVPEEMAIEIRELIQDSKRNLNGFYIRSQLVFMGRAFWIGRESAVRVLRVFKKSEGNFDQTSVHERVQIRLNQRVHTRTRLRHFSYPSIKSYLDKMNRYSTFGAQEVLRLHPRRCGIFWALGFPIKFVQFYVVQLNFLNGWAGFCWSLLSAFAFFVKYLKVVELRQKSQE
jgi:glycosyltransferase involved in cell wall biosynthesis